MPHPRPWEREVEAWIRSRTPPAGPDESLRLGVEGSALLAVGAAAVAEHRDDLCIVKLQAVAVSVTARGRGGAIADRLLDEMLAASTRLSDRFGAARTIVVAWVHPRSQPSRRLLARGGLVLRGPAPAGYEEWILEVV